MSKFKINERVAFYHYGCRYIGLIDSFNDLGVYLINIEDGDKVQVHEKQIRRLKKN
jgi:hypothetical protein